MCRVERWEAALFCSSRFSTRVTGRIPAWTAAPPASVGGKTSTQEELLSTLTALIQDGRRVVLSADRPPLALTPRS